MDDSEELQRVLFDQGLKRYAKDIRFKCIF